MSEKTVTRKSERPDKEWERGTCPYCGETCVSNAYYIGGKNGHGAYGIVIECWASLGEAPTCSYRRWLT